ncbi:hypothetical protein BGZ99_007953 [Dissophora globulifera]|uniref:Carboxylic ester hydrolase n=1 Tax=Dissophora globulifera TaxID=979702 RepID=A0A9P6RAA5_9FUNG|nr:hypothetical protein BGZ99_007953 [Dissophora globulifera]
MMLGLPGPGFEFSERDCLNLNIFAPRLCRDIPVICYIHGGSNQGGNALPKNDATNIVKQSIAKETPVVVVTVNYRLLPSAGLLEAPKEDPQGGEREGEKVNWGLYDQKLALEWIRKHIHNFGGNRNEITLMGHSNGASSAGYHLLTAQNEGLFKRAIMHSESKNVNGSKRAGPRLEERGQLSESKSESKATASQLSSVVYESVGECSMGPAAQFTFMSDACTPYMSESEKQLGIQVIGRWIDFAWGKSGKPDGEKLMGVHNHLRYELKNCLRTLPTVSQPAAIKSSCSNVLLFCRHLQGHHDLEEAAVFPAWAEVVDISHWSHSHEILDHTLGNVRNLAQKGIDQGGRDFDADKTTLIEQLQNLSDIVLPHLRDEEYLADPAESIKFWPTERDMRRAFPWVGF